ncbi:MAG: hypothetical protein IJN05_10570 [Ruminococcus sp.]|nr:hypothetical protein [Ruminococcus sp.]
MLKLKNIILSYIQYYKICIAYSLISSIIWAIGGIVDLLDILDDKSLPVIIIYYTVHGLSILITFEIFVIANAMRDKEDELYKENIAKTNSAFLWFLFFAGLALYIIASILKLSAITLPLNHWLIGAVIYMLYAVYNIYALHYESSASNAEDE